MSRGALKRSSDQPAERWKRAAVVCGVALALLVLFGALVFYIVDDEASKRESARTSLSNCQQIEAIKAQLTGVLEDSLARIPTTAYYDEHPDELAEAVKNTKDAIERFAPDDCYSLPAVRDAGLKRPEGPTD